MVHEGDDGSGIPFSCSETMCLAFAYRAEGAVYASTTMEVPIDDNMMQILDAYLYMVSRARSNSCWSTGQPVNVLMPDFD
jgi:hypothetical protein